MGEIWGRVIVTPHPNPLPQGEGTKTSLSLRERAGVRVLLRHVLQKFLQTRAWRILNQRLRIAIFSNTAFINENQA